MKGWSSAIRSGKKISDRKGKESTQWEHCVETCTKEATRWKDHTCSPMGTVSEVWDGALVHAIGGTWYSLSNQPTNIFQEILICLNKINSKPTFMQLEKISEIESNFEFSFLKRLLFGRDLKNNWASIQMNMGLLVWSNDEPFDFKVRLK